MCTPWIQRGSAPAHAQVSKSKTKHSVCILMEFEEAHNNIRAVRLLYRLLEDNSLALQDANLENITTTQAGISKTISDTEGTKSKTLSSLGEENGMNMVRQNLIKATNQSNEKGISRSIESDNHEQQLAGESNKDNSIPFLNDVHEGQCNLNAARLVESLEQKDDFTDDLVNVVKRIESRILAFQLCSNLVDSTKKDACHHPLHKAANLESPKMQRKDRVAGSQLSCRRSLLERNQQADKSTCKGENLISQNAFEEPFIARKEPLSQNGLHTNSESAKKVYIPKQIGTQLVSGGEELRRGTKIQPSAQDIAMTDRAKSLNRLVSGDVHLGSQASECIQGLRIPLNQDDLTKKPSMYASQTNREILVRKTPVAWSKTNQNPKERGSKSSHAQKLAKFTPTIDRREKPLPHKMVIKPTLLDQRSSEIKVNSHQHNWSVLDRRGTHKTGHVEPQKTRARPQPHELEESSSIPDSSSQWTSQQGSTYSSKSSDSEDPSLAVGTQGPKSGWIVNVAYEGSSEESSNKDDRTQGPKSGWMVNAAYEGSSEESSNSYLYKYDSPSHRVGSLKSYRHHRKRSPKKAIGGLKSLKNKLGLIHHHHHHHHHHQHHDDDDYGSIHSNAGHKHSMWNNLQNVFHHKNKHGMLTNKKVEKTRRGAIRRVLPRSNLQVGQFHRIVEGLLRHIRHSKKPKPFKHGRVKGSRPHGHSQKKLHWWQIPRRRRGVKLKNRGRVNGVYKPKINKELRMNLGAHLNFWSCKYCLLARGMTVPFILAPLKYAEQVYLLIFIDILALLIARLVILPILLMLAW